MPATSRWVYFDPATTTAFTISNPTADPDGTGTEGYVQASNAISGNISITAGVADQIQVSVDGNAFQQITLTSGASMDPRTVARDIEWKLKQLSQTEFDYVRCELYNNKFRISSSTLGSTSIVDVDNGANDCLHLLGMASSQGGPLTVTQASGSASANNGAYTGSFVASGTYKGQFSDVYTLFIGTQHPIGAVVPSGTNVYVGSGISTGSWNQATNEVYTVVINTANGAVMNNGVNNVPTYTFTSDQGDNSGSATELLYADFYYAIGTKGLRVKFTDAPFGNNDTFTITCSAIAFAAGTNTASGVGAAQYHWSSLREGKSSSATTTSIVGSALGTRGLTAAFSNSGLLTRRDQFRVIASGPQPTTIGITLLNFGSVTVSTYSPTKVVWFELIAGATILSSPRFGLQSHGTAAHHFAGSNDTKFAFGNVGEGSPASDGTEYKVNISGSVDLTSDTPPSYLAATEDNLAVVSDASSSESIGVAHGEMVTDFTYLAIKLGAAETGANSTIVFREFFDFS